MILKLIVRNVSKCTNHVPSFSNEPITSPESTIYDPNWQEYVSESYIHVKN